MTKTIAFNLFEMNTVGHISQGLWVHPENNRHRFNDVEFWVEHARLLEEGLFDAVFLADVVGAYDGYRGGPETAIREAVQIPNNDPLLVIPAMAAATRHLGFAATFSTTYEPPFAFARRASTLDHLTGGRFGWNIVTSYLPSAARNFGLATEVEHDRRYRIAEEYLDVLYKLWEGSWDDDAVVQDRANHVYADPAKVRPINHVGEHFSVAGPHLSQPSPQRTPVLFQAGSSGTGKAFAARHAEAVFVGGHDTAAIGRNVADLRHLAEESGRGRDAVKAYASAVVIVGKDRDAAQAKAEEFRRLARAEGHLAHAGGGGVDLAAYPSDMLVAEAEARAGMAPEQVPSNRRYPRGTTVGQALAEVTRFDRGLFAVGSPTDVVDRIEGWVRDTDLDGFNLRQFLTPGTAEDFVEHVVPELQRRGLYRTRYAETTLRERLFGPGVTRLPETHPAARYRDGSGLTGAAPLGAAAPADPEGASTAAPEPDGASTAALLARTWTGAAEEPPRYVDVAERLRPVFARIRAGAVERESRRELPFDQVRWLTEAGFGAVRVRRDLGGDGVSLTQLVELVIELAAADSNVAHLFRGHFAFLEQELTHPDVGHRERWARAAVAGELVGNASSELGNGGLWDTRTSVGPDADGRWLLDGVKYYSTGTIFSDWVSVGAVRPDGERVSVAVPTDAPGVTVLDDWDGFGQRMTGSGTTRLEQVAVDEDAVVPFSARTPNILPAYYQLYLLAVLAGIGRAAVADAIDFVRPRKRTYGNGSAPAPRHDPLVQGVVGRLSSASFAADATVLTAAGRLDALTRAIARGEAEAAQHEAVDTAVNQAQVIVCELVLRATTDLFEVGGASATSEARRLDRHWRNARTIASHNPRVVKEQVIGDHLLNGVPPSSTFATRVPRVEPAHPVATTT